MRTSDGGASWTRPSALPGVPLNAVSFLDANTGWVGGDDTSTTVHNARPAAHTTDGGDSWSGPLFPRAGDRSSDAYSFKALSVMEPNRLWAVGELCRVILGSFVGCHGTIWRLDSADWTESFATGGCFPSQDCGFYAVSFADANNGWAAERRSRSGPRGCGRKSLSAMPDDVIERFAIEATLTKQGWLSRTPGGWC